MEDSDRTFAYKWMDFLLSEQGPSWLQIEKKYLENKVSRIEKNC